MQFEYFYKLISTKQICIHSCDFDKRQILLLSVQYIYYIYVPKLTGELRRCQSA